MPFFETFETFGGIGGQLDEVTLHFEQRFETLPDVRLIINYQDSAFKGRG
jgi:hypothetical protein